jgi:hypothetical protein
MTSPSGPPRQGRTVLAAVEELWIDAYPVTNACSRASLPTLAMQPSARPRDTPNPDMAVVAITTPGLHEETPSDRQGDQYPAASAALRNPRSASAVTVSRCESRFRA